MKLKLFLISLEKKLSYAWEKFCGDLDFVEVYQGDVLVLSVDAVISPANSFGFMDGGIDLAYSRRFGWTVQERLQDIIKDKHHGELLVGSAEIIDTNDNEIPYLISAPTMRVPQTLVNSMNPYLAARAVFLLIKFGYFERGMNIGKPISSVIKSIALPGLGTGAGEINPLVCSKQVRLAIDDIILDKFKFPRSWIQAQRDHYALIRDKN